MAKQGKDVGVQSPRKPPDTLRQRGHDRWDQLCDEAENADFYGEVGVIGTFKAGQLRSLKRHLIGTDQ